MTEWWAQTGYDHAPANHRGRGLRCDRIGLDDLVRCDNCSGGQPKTWIGPLNKLPYRTEIPSDAAGGTTTTTTVVNEYDDTIQIKAPQVGG